MEPCREHVSWHQFNSQALSSWWQESLKSSHPKLPAAEELFGSEAPGSSDPCPPWCPTWSPKASKVETLRNPPTVPTLEVIMGTPHVGQETPWWPRRHPEEVGPKALGSSREMLRKFFSRLMITPQKKKGDWRYELEKTSHTVQKMASFRTESKMQWRQANPDPVSAIRRTNSSLASCRWNCQEIFVVSLRYEFICLGRDSSRWQSSMCNRM